MLYTKIRMVCVLVGLSSTLCARTITSSGRAAARIVGRVAYERNSDESRPDETPGSVALQLSPELAFVLRLDSRAAAAPHARAHRARHVWPNRPHRIAERIDDLSEGCPLRRGGIVRAVVNGSVHARLRACLQSCPGVRARAMAVFRHTDIQDPRPPPRERLRSSAIRVP